MPAMKKLLSSLGICLLLFAPPGASVAETSPADAAPQARRVVLKPTEKLQRLDGWGVSLCWWANMCGRWSEAKVDSLVNMLVSPDGLNYNVFRYNIPGGEDPQNRNCKKHHMASGKGLRAEMDGFKDYPTDSYDWSRDEAQRRIMLKIRERRPDAVFEAFSNTPPYFMTYSGCCGGAVKATDDNLRTECYEDFARYLLDVCQHYKERYGLEFKTLEPFNEPETDYWYANGSQEGCHFSIPSMIKFVKVLSPMLKASGLKTVLSLTDETSVEQSVKDYKAFRADPEAFRAIGQWNVHTYKADSASRTELRRLVAADGLTLWMSETGEGGSGLKGNLALAQRMFDDLRQLQPAVWCDWQVMEENNDQWCTVRGSFADGSFHRVKNYYVRRQITGFIKQGYTLLSTTDAQTLAALSPAADSLVIVCLNNGDGSRNYEIDTRSLGSLKGTPQAWVTDSSRDCAKCASPKAKGGILSLNLPAQSIMTAVVRLK